MKNNVSGIENIYFVGIGGIGMSALARYFHTRRLFVAGYDKTPSPLTAELQREGIPVHFKDDTAVLTAEITATPREKTLIVYTPAVPADSTLLTYFRENGYTLMKRSQVLGLLTENSYSICIAGTHGKTTTTSLTAHILEYCRKKPTVFAGGILSNYNTNFINHPDGTITVSEADEFDRSFLWLSPDLAVITSIDADHLDIYGDKGTFEKGFRDFAARIHPQGSLLLNENAAAAGVIGTPHEVYGFGEACVHRAIPTGVEQYNFTFEVQSSVQAVNGRYLLPMPGRHNVSNALAAIVLAGKCGCTQPEIAEALRHFKGIKRRFEWIVRNDKIAYIDDYAHHPTEIKAAIEAARELFPGKKLTVAFQPHLYSRTRDFEEGFAQELAKADELLLLDIYPARELPIEGVSSEHLLEKIKITDKKLIHKEQLADHIKANRKQIEVLMTLGAGDIDRSVEPIREYLESE